MPVIAKRVAGVCIVRDAVDLIPFVCGHYLRIGFDRIAFIDDGSSDGTFDFLKRLSRRTRRVSVTQVVCDQFRQSEHMNRVTNDLIDAGYSIIVPFDCDEFWCLQARELEAALAPWTETAFKGRWVNFVQRRTALRSQAFGLLGMIHRAPESAVADQSSVTGFRESFVFYKANKVALKTTRPVELDLGQHNLLKGPETRFAYRHEIFHVPMRSRREIEKRGLNYEPRRAPTRTDPGVNWQSVHHRNVMLSGKLDEEWNANSVDKNGRLDVYGKPVDLPRDRRLQYVLLKSAAYLAARYGMSVW
jgi:hypothetical protein